MTTKEKTESGGGTEECASRPKLAFYMLSHAISLQVATALGLVSVEALTGLRIDCYLC